MRDKDGKLYTFEDLERMKGDPLTNEEDNRIISSHRAGGDVICKTCGKSYYDHPMYIASAKTCGYPWLHELCNGDLVKL